MKKDNKIRRALTLTRYCHHLNRKETMTALLDAQVLPLVILRIVLHYIGVENKTSSLFYILLWNNIHIVKVFPLKYFLDEFIIIRE